MVKAIVFDIGGVIDSDEWGERFLDEYAKILGVEKEELDRVVRSQRHRYLRGNITEDEFWKEVTERLGVKADINLLKKKYRELLTKKDGALDIAKKLKGKYLIGAMSNAGKEWYEYRAEKHGWKDLFDFSVNSFETGYRKPERGIYMTLLEELGKRGVSPEEVIFIDDRDENIAAAKMHKIKTIKYISPEQLEKELREAGVEL
ncbi:MAG: HAD family phosphatase [Candidatus Diapherotrites archaeon]|nr:HAD family phosphatase [Candidatus Diapherotrites archaeon]